MKKAVSFLLIVFLTLALLACGNTPAKDDMHTQKPALDSMQNPSETASETPHINLNIEDGTFFGSNLAIVRLKGEKQLSVIDTAGSVLFKIQGSLFDTDTFAHDIAILNQGGSNLVLCLKDGTTRSPEEFGATGFYHFPSLHRQSLLDEGLIVMENANNKTAGVLGPDLKWIVPLSESFYNNLKQMDFCDAFINGCYITNMHSDDACYLNLRTGEISYNFATLPGENPADYYYLNQLGEIVDLKTDRIIAVLENIGDLPNGDRDTFFCNNMIFVQDLVAPQPNSFLVRHYIVGADGGYIMEPKEREPLLMGALDNSVRFAEETLIIANTEEVTQYEKGSESLIILETAWSSYDTDGTLLGSFSVPAPDKVGEKTFLRRADLSFKNGIFKLEYLYLTRDGDVNRAEQHVVYLDRNMQPLF